jgi:hypothetical protein
MPFLIMGNTHIGFWFFFFFVVQAFLELSILLPPTQVLALQAVLPHMPTTRVTELPYLGFPRNKPQDQSESANHWICEAIPGDAGRGEGKKH